MRTREGYYIEGLKRLSNISPIPFSDPSQQYSTPADLRAMVAHSLWEIRGCGESSDQMRALDENRADLIIRTAPDKFLKIARARLKQQLERNLVSQKI